MNTLPVRLQEASGAITEHLDIKHRLSSLAERRLIAKQTVGSNVALLRFTRHVNTVVLEVHMRCNCKHLLICKEDEIDGTFWKFTEQLLARLIYPHSAPVHVVS